jgi:DNA-directed RNA polymerase subunit RPC12/RpoP
MEVENDYGAWEVEVCVNCGEQVHKHCPHHHNSWNEDETVLTCDNCGADGT